jgi:hypothetical protein
LAGNGDQSTGISIALMRIELSLDRLDRYEARALSRHRSAVRRLTIAERGDDNQT